MAVCQKIVVPHFGRRLFFRHPINGWAGAYTHRSFTASIDTASIIEPVPVPRLSKTRPRHWPARVRKVFLFTANANLSSCLHLPCLWTVAPRITVSHGCTGFNEACAIDLHEVTFLFLEIYMLAVSSFLRSLWIVPPVLPISSPRVCVSRRSHATLSQGGGYHHPNAGMNPNQHAALSNACCHPQTGSLPSLRAAVLTHAHAQLCPYP